jgi:hypothetical protein
VPKATSFATRSIPPLRRYRRLVRRDQYRLCADTGGAQTKRRITVFIPNTRPPSTGAGNARAEWKPGD